MRPFVFRAASAARRARFRTSSATTANPAPASPARAASTAAFRASRFVWKAISSIVLMIFPVSSLVLVISAIAPAISFICRSTFSTISFVSCIIALAWLALSAFCFVIEAISSREEEVSSRDDACSDAPSARDWLAVEIWFAAAVTSPAVRFRKSAARKMGRAVERARNQPAARHEETDGQDRDQDRPDDAP